MTANVVSLVPATPDPQPIGTMYRVVRDATVMHEGGVSTAEKIAVLELVKAELLRGLLETIHP